VSLDDVFPDGPVTPAFVAELLDEDLFELVVPGETYASPEGQHRHYQLVIVIDGYDALDYPILSETERFAIVQGDATDPEVVYGLAHTEEGWQKVDQVLTQTSERLDAVDDLHDRLRQHTAVPEDAQRMYEWEAERFGYGDGGEDQ
jgi:hypothetical protein